jgi:hypothetical protein
MVCRGPCSFGSDPCHRRHPGSCSGGSHPDRHQRQDYDRRAAGGVHQGVRHRPLGGNFWYDPASGLWGVMGREAFGVLQPGLPYGPVSPTASAGNTGVFINGRQINLTEALYIKSLLGVGPAGTLVARRPVRQLRRGGEPGPGRKSFRHREGGGSVPRRQQLLLQQRDGTECADHAGVRQRDDRHPGQQGGLHHRV